VQATSLLAMLALRSCNIWMGENKPLQVGQSDSENGVLARFVFCLWVKVSSEVKRKQNRSEVTTGTNVTFSEGFGAKR
jgi:hypothetical protein